MSDPSTHSRLDLDSPDKTYLDSNELIINMGPQHPATHGVLRVILKLDGERVLGTECVIGYLHRGVEKIRGLPAGARTAGSSLSERRGSHFRSAPAATCAG